MTTSPDHHRAASSPDDGPTEGSVEGRAKSTEARADGGRGPGGQSEAPSEATSHGPPSKDSRPSTLEVRLEAEDAPCPNCGTLLPGPHAILCPSCGFDIVKATRAGTVVGRPIQEDRQRAAREDASGSHGADASDRTPPLIGAAGTTLPIGVAAVALLTVVGFALAGWTGLFRSQAGQFLDSAGAFSLDAPRWTDRIATVARILVQTTTLAVAVLGGVLLMAIGRPGPIGDRATFLARIAAIAAVAQLGLLIALPPPMLEWSAELAIQALVVLGLVVLWFRFTLREGVQVLGGTLVISALLQIGARLVVWAG